jgi:hypothetical protein
MALLEMLGRSGDGLEQVCGELQGVFGGLAAQALLMVLSGLGAGSDGSAAGFGSTPHPGRDLIGLDRVEAAERGGRATNYVKSKEIARSGDDIRV